MNRKQINVKVFEGRGVSYGGPNWPPDEADGFIAWFSEKIKSIPDEYRPTATIEISTDDFSSVDEDDAPEPVITIMYTRHETDDEMRVRHEQEQARVRQEADNRRVIRDVLNRFDTHNKP